MRSFDTPLIAEHNMLLLILAFQVCLRGNMKFIYENFVVMLSYAINLTVKCAMERVTWLRWRRRMGVTIL